MTRQQHKKQQSNRIRLYATCLFLFFSAFLTLEVSHSLSHSKDTHSTEHCTACKFSQAQQHSFTPENQPSFTAPPSLPITVNATALKVSLKESSLNEIPVLRGPPHC